MKGLLRLFVTASVLMAGSVARAQCPGEVSDPLLTLPGVDGTRITAMVEWDPDGAGPLGSVLVVSGDFGHAGSVAAAGMAVWDGDAWSAFPAPIANAPALTVFNGQLVAAVPFVATGEPFAGAVKVWDGAGWQSMGALWG